MRHLALSVLLCCGAVLAKAESVPAPVTTAISEAVPEAIYDAQVVILGEVHDNPAHHVRQAEIVARLKPKAIVFEMLTETQVEGARSVARADREALEKALGWNASGWPDFAMYHPIFAGAPEAQIYGAAVPREAARAAMTAGIAESFGSHAQAYGLTDALSDVEQSAREAMQHQAHCEALPAKMLPVMVELQRLRDAVLARAVVRALAEVGGPVAVITGNGHARRDWGMAPFLTRIAPDVTVFSLGQSEAGHAPEGGFDAVVDSPPVERPDPCEAFSKG